MSNTGPVKKTGRLGKRCVMTTWILRGCPVGEAAIKRLANEVNLPLPLAQVMAVRGLADTASAKEWLAAARCV